MSFAEFRAGFIANFELSITKTHSGKIPGMWQYDFAIFLTGETALKVNYAHEKPQSVKQNFFIQEISISY